jgi:tRNA (mo5U34)-methyltransferase
VSLQSSGRAAGRPEIARLGPWFHNLHLPDGTETAPDHPLGDFPGFKWNELSAALPADLAGWRVLDIGCNAGYYSIELARRGAKVLGVDHDPHYLSQAAWARSQFGLDEGQLELSELGVYDLAGIDGQFDLVLFMGVLYHLRYPLLALDLVTEHVGGLLVFQTLCSPGDVTDVHVPADLKFEERHRLLETGWPSMAFIEHELAGDPTNWWVPNRTAVESMLRSCGLRVVSRPLDETWICERDHENPHRSELERATGRHPSQIAGGDQRRPRRMRTPTR